MSSANNKAVDLASYTRGDHRSGPWLLCAVWYLVSLALIESPLPWPVTVKRAVLRCFGARLGEGVVLKPRLRIKLPWKLRVGDHSWLGEEVWIDNLAPVHIGSNVCLSQGACILTGNHDRSSPHFDLRPGPVSLADGTWIGARVLVCPGTETGNCVVAEAGAVVRGKLEAFGIYAGNPATHVGGREIS